MLMIRLRRMGAKHRPFYRIVVSDSRRTPRAAAVEELGYYDPKVTPRKIELDREKVEYWIGKGAKASPRVLQLMDQQARESA